jgi:hypothetical protein
LHKTTECQEPMATVELGCDIGKDAGVGSGLLPIVFWHLVLSVVAGGTLKCGR